MKKKLLALCLSICMTGGLLAGCGSAKADNGAAPDNQTQAETPAADNANAAGETGKEPVELTLWVTSRNTDDWSTEMENK